jgi:hypothetical protein
MAMRIKNPKAFDWDYDGECFHQNWSYNVSVSIFQWVPTKDGKGIKRSKSVKRISGPRKDRAGILKRAEAWIQENCQEKIR